MEVTNYSKSKIQKLKKWEYRAVLLMAVIVLIHMVCVKIEIGNRYILNIFSSVSCALLMIFNLMLSCYLRKKRVSTQKYPNSIIGLNEIIYFLLACIFFLELYDTIAQTNYLYKIFESGFFYLF